jgi:hypothetical protein
MQQFDVSDFVVLPIIVDGRWSDRPRFHFGSSRPKEPRQQLFERRDERLL